MASGADTMPSYAPTRGEFGLLNPIWNATDEVVQKVTRRAALATPEERRRLRAAMTDGDMYTLTRFGERAAVFALRRNDISLIRDGLAAVALVTYERFDFRDFVFESLPTVANKLGHDGRALVFEAADLAEGKTAEALRQRMDAPARVWDSENAYLVDTSLGFGWLSRFSTIGPHVKAAMPTALKVAQAMEAWGPYVARIEGERSIPDVWFASADAKALLAPVKHPICVMGELAPDAYPELPKDQRWGVFLNVWMAKLEPAAANQLANLANASTMKDATVMGIAAGHWFALVVSRTAAMAAPPIESKRSLEPLRRAVAAAMGQNPDTPPSRRGLWARLTGGP